MDRSPETGDSMPVPLHQFLARHHDEILHEWEIADRVLPSALGMPSSTLRNSIPDILSEIAAGAKLLRAGQTTVKLPRGKSREHTLQRLGHDFSLEEIALEYTLLRRIILRLVKKRGVEFRPEESSFLHEVIDQAILEAAITYSAETSKKLKEEHLLLLAVIEQMPAAVLIAEAPSGRLLVANRQVQRIWGYPAAPLEDVRRHHRYHAFRKDGKQYPPTTWPLARAVEHGEVVSNEEAQVERADGEQRIVLISAAPVRDVDDKRTAAVAAVTDITEFREAQQALLAERERLAVTLASISDGVISTDAEGIVTYLNPAAERLTGWRTSDARRESLDRVFPLVNTESGDRLPSIWQQVVAEKKPFSLPMHRALERRDGDLVRIEKTVAPLLDHDGRLLGTVTAFREVSETHALAERLSHLASHDPLTGVPNRALLEDRIEHAMERAERQNTRLGLLFLDIDRFKEINDGLGHPAGDQLLKEVADRLRRHVRRSDTVSRLGGDEFVILVEDLDQPLRLHELATQISDAIREPCLLNDSEVRTSASIGISVFPEDGTNVHDLLAHADTAMYHAKRNGRNNYQFFELEMNQRANQRRQLEDELREALAHNGLELYFQPQYSLASTRMIGGEALLRWHHPELGAIPPRRFVALAEESDLIVPLNNWVLDEACRRAREWTADSDGQIPVFVNVSATQFRQEDLSRRVAEALDRHGLAPDRFGVEISEAVMMDDPQRTADAIHGLHDLGVHISVDDFGIGHSSLRYLKDLPVSELKVDHSFVSRMEADSREKQLVHAIIHIGHSLNLRVIAEGVENERTAAVLRDYNCDAAQGHYYSAPVPPEDFQRLLGRH